MPDQPPITEHAARRAKERLGLNRRALGRLAASALEDGLKVGDTRGTLRRYLEGKMILHPDCYPRIHGCHVFIFGDAAALITVWGLPHEFRRSAESARKKKGAAE